MIKSFFLYLLVYLSISITAQVNYDIQYFGEEAGFYDTDDITDIKTDLEGNVWIISFSGITKYDGYEFKRINSSSTNHSSFIRFNINHKGKPFVVDLTGRIFFLEADSLKPFHLNEKLLKDFKGDRYRDIHFDKKGCLYISNFSNSKEFENEDTTIIKFLNRNKGLGGQNYLLDTEYPVTFFNLIKRYDDERKYTLLDRGFRILDSLIFYTEPGNQVFKTEICRVSKSEYLISNGKGVLIEVENNKFLNHLKYKNIIRLLKKNNFVLISTYNDGIRLHPLNNYSEAPILELFPKEFAFASTIDKNGGVWIYSKNNGLARLRFKNQRIISEPKSNINLLEVNNGFLYTQYEKNKIEKRNLLTDEVFKFELSVDTNRFWDSTDFFNSYQNPINKILWFSARYGVSYLKNSKIDLLDLNNLALFPRSGSRYILGKIVESDSIDFIASKLDELFIKHIDSLKPIRYGFESKITAIIKVHNFTWVATELGVFLLNNNKEVTFLGEKHPILSKVVTNFEYFDNRLFFNVDRRGLFYMDSSRVKELRFSGYSIENAIIEKRNDHELWAFSNLGSFLIQSNSGKIKIERFNPLPDNKIKRIALHDRKIYYQTNKNVVLEMDLDSIQTFRFESPVFNISKVVNSKKNYLDSTHVVNFKYDYNDIEFLFSCTDFRKEALRFRYRLLGLTNRWVETRERKVFYASLMPGEYKFELQLRLGEKPWSNSKFVQVNIAKPFFKEWWFISLVILFFLSSIYIIISSRLKRNKKENELLIDNLKAEQRALRAQINPHFIFNIISSAQYFILKKDNEKANKFLNMFSKLLRNNLKQSGQNTVSLKQELLIIENYLQLEKFRLEDKFKFEIHSDKIGDVLEDQIPQFLIQPFIENAVHHGVKDLQEPGEIKVKFSFEGNYFKVIIEDNGLGINYSKRIKEKYKTEKESFGIAITNKRLSIYNGNNKGVEIIDRSEEDERGTKVIMYIKKN